MQESHFRLHSEGIRCVMRGQHGLHTMFGEPVLQPRQHLVACFTIQRRKRLVEKQQPRHGRQRPRQGNALRLAARERSNSSINQVRGA